MVLAAAVTRSNGRANVHAYDTHYIRYALSRRLPSLWSWRPRHLGLKFRSLGIASLLFHDHLCHRSSAPTSKRGTLSRAALRPSSLAVLVGLASICDRPRHFHHPPHPGYLLSGGSHIPTRGPPAAAATTTARPVHRPTMAKQRQVDVGIDALFQHGAARRIGLYQALEARLAQPELVPQTKCAELVVVVL
eukprot:scaffold1220_cov117-Isochrysis_galbana.AAC.5